MKNAFCHSIPHKPKLLYLQYDAAVSRELKDITIEVRPVSKIQKIRGCRFQRSSREVQRFRTECLTTALIAEGSKERKRVK